ncbi:MAG TPA: D-glucuronyl C5-epimerase family protein [Gaiellaceae bacterium]
MTTRIRATVGAVDWAWRSALSRGLSFEPTPRGRAFARDSVGPYCLNFTAKTNQPDESRLLPADVAQLALGWWERASAGEEGATLRFLATAERLLADAHRYGSALFWPYDVPVPKYGLRPPWHSALAQGQAASVFVRAAQATAEERYADAAVAAIAPLLEPGELLAITDAGPILQEAPSSPPSHILNGWVQALWGLRDVAVGLDVPAAEHAWTSGVETLARVLDAYDVGWWTRYSLYPHALADLAKPIYQRLHVDLVDVLHEQTGMAEFGTVAAKWRRYDRLAARWAAVAHKAAFVALDARRRRREAMRG